MWHEAICAQRGDHHVVTLYSASEDHTEAVLTELGVEVVTDDEPGRTVQHIEAHAWGIQHWYSYMARLRNQLLDLAAERDADYFFSVDSDIILEPRTTTALLQIMLHSGCHVISPAVNMSKGQFLAWNTMNWDSDIPGSALRVHYPDKAGPVDVVMAAMLLDRTAIEQCRWAVHAQGEDVGFCLDAQLKGISRWWVPEIVAQHLMIRF
jgi:hypothetical protein